MSRNLGGMSGGTVGSRRVGPLFGLSFFVPGLPQLIWGQRERAFFLAGSFLTALGVGLFAWGTLLGLLLLVFAYIVHVASMADAIGQWAFPSFERWMPRLTVSLILALGLYGPLVMVGSFMAWPGKRPGQAVTYLVNRSSYAESMPESGDWIWLPVEKGTTLGRVVEVVALPGQTVEWNANGLLVNGKKVGLVPFQVGHSPRELEFQVPEGQLLVAAMSDADLMPRAWEFVSLDRVEGRAWAKLYPVWDRRILD